MKLKKIAHLALCCALVFLAGCSGNKNAEEEAVVTEAPTETPTPEPTADPTASPEPEPTVSPEPAEVLPEGMVRSYLTGEPVAEEIGRRRPAAVMINNIEACLPHWGISHAGVFYEAPVEGGISRIMAIFEDYDQVERIGSVRSCRNYFIFYASGFEAVYVHYGQSAYAVPYLDLPEVNNLSGLSGYGDQIFYRTSDRNPPITPISAGRASGRESPSADIPTVIRKIMTAIISSPPPGNRSFWKRGGRPIPSYQAASPTTIRFLPTIRKPGFTTDHSLERPILTRKRENSWLSKTF